MRSLFLLILMMCGKGALAQSVDLGKTPIFAQSESRNLYQIRIGKKSSSVIRGHKTTETNINLRDITLCMIKPISPARLNEARTNGDETCAQSYPLAMVEPSSLDAISRAICQSYLGKEFVGESKGQLEMNPKLIFRTGSVFTRLSGRMLLHPLSGETQALKVTEIDCTTK